MADKGDDRTVLDVLRTIERRLDRHYCILTEPYERLLSAPRCDVHDPDGDAHDSEYESSDGDQREDHHTDDKDQRERAIWAHLAALARLVAPEALEPETPHETRIRSFLVGLEGRYWNNCEWSYDHDTGSFSVTHDPPTCTGWFLQWRRVDGDEDDALIWRQVKSPKHMGWNEEADVRVSTSEMFDAMRAAS